MKRIIIIGNSAAGISAATTIRKKDKETKVLIISDEESLAYYRCLLSYYLAGEISRQSLSFKDESFYKENDIELVLAKKVIRVEPKKNRIILEDKSSLSYDYLLVASGASAKIPPLRGVNKNGVFGFRTLADVKKISEFAKLSNTACIWGGGLIGLKTASALKKKNLEVKVIVRSKHILSQMLDEVSSNIFRRRFEENGIEIMTEKDIIEIIGDGDLKAIRLNTGKVIACQILIIAKGISPNIDFLKESEIKLNKGILVDEFLKTNIPNIYAAGDVAESYDLLYKQRRLNPLWPHAIREGKVAGLNILGFGQRYEGALGMNAVEFFDLPAISMGITQAKTEEYEELLHIAPEEDIYKKVVLKDKKIVGMIFLGEIKNSGLILRLIKEEADVSKIKSELLSNTFNYLHIKNLVAEKEEVFF